MARRLTAEHSEFLLEDTIAAAARLTAEHSEFLLEDTVVAKARLTSIHIEWLLQDNVINIADSNAANWADSVAIGFFAPPGPLSRAVSDNLAITGPASSKKDAWKDGLQLDLRPYGDLFIAIDDLETYFADDLAIGIGIAVGDDLNNWNDFAKPAAGYLVEAFDSMFYNQADLFALSIGIGVSVGDNLNAYSDGINLNQTGSRDASDSLNQWQDQVLVAATTLPAAFDTMVMSDAIQLMLSVHLGVSDNLNNWLDSVQLSPFSVSLSRAVADTLAMTDAAQTLLSGYNTTYLRRYLNDVIR